MIPFHKTKIQKRPGSIRAGLSIIEVLTSVVVAMIGVFGVMILIPFAVKQAQTGLDSDAAVILGLNASSRFEIEGYRSPNNWGVYRGTNAPTVTAYSPYAVTDQNNDGDTTDAGDGPDLPAVFSIDPLAVNECGLLSPALWQQASAANVWFPYNRLDLNLPTTLPPEYQIRPATLGTPAGALMTTEIARRMFRVSDDLVFGEASDDLLGPEQVFDLTGTTQLRRQSGGRLSWSAIVVPFKPDGTTAGTQHWSYKMYILVYKDRKTLIADPNGQMATGRLEPLQNSGTHSPVTNVYFEPGVYVQPTATLDGVVRDDWVMLINRSLNTTDDGAPPAGVTYAEKGFDRQIAFYRVVSVADGIGAPAAGNRSTLSSLTIDGPDFSFGNPSNTSASSVIRDTYAVHLQDVIGVYERTFEPEFESNWN